MKKTKSIKISLRFVVAALVTAMVITSCKPKVTHLTQNLENSIGAEQGSTQTSVVSTQTPDQETGQVQSPSPVSNPTEPSISPLATQTASAPVLTPTSSSLVLTPTSTSKSSTPQAGTSTLVPTRTATATTTKTATAGPTPTLPTGWEGEWTAYVMQGDGSVLVGILTVSLAGEQVNGELEIGGSLMNLQGNIQSAGTQVNGSYAGYSGSGYFKWITGGAGSFAGNLDNQRAFCGARQGLPQPDPCGYFDPE